MTINHQHNHRISLPDSVQSVPCMAATDGVVIGTVHIQQRELTDGDGDSDRIFSLEELRHAVTLTHSQLESFQSRIHGRIEESVSEVFRAHLAILRDTELMARIEGGVRAQRPAVAMIRETYGYHIELLSRHPMERMQEKVQDLEDIANRLIRNLLGQGQVCDDLHGRIVVARVLYPSDLLRLVAQDAAGAILVGVGVTAHINVLARSLQLPLVTCDTASAELLKEGMPVLLDGGQGLLLTAADQGTLAEYGTQVDTSGAELVPLRPETATADGRRIRLLANVGLLGEAQLAHDLGSDGIGLYRSEISFLLRDKPPSEDEQVAVYRRVLELAPGNYAVIRLLDLGGDKIAAYFPHDVGPNPSLGLRGIRFSFHHPEIFATQVRAILRAGHGYDLHILMPMVSSVDCFRRVRSVMMACSSALVAAKVPHNPAPLLGAMIELPSAVLLAQEIAHEADFLALGTNDLIQYILAVDRSDDRVADWYVPWHPAVLRAIKQVADVASAASRPLSICGEIACDEVLLPILIGMGVTAFSVPPRALGRIQAVISTLRFDRAAALAKEVLACVSIAEVEEALGMPSAAMRNRELMRYP